MVETGGRDAIVRLAPADPGQQVEILAQRQEADAIGRAAELLLHIDVVLPGRAGAEGPVAAAEAIVELALDAEVVAPAPADQGVDGAGVGAFDLGLVPAQIAVDPRLVGGIHGLRHRWDRRSQNRGGRGRHKHEFHFIVLLSRAGSAV